MVESMTNEELLAHTQLDCSEVIKELRKRLMSKIDNADGLESRFDEIISSFDDLEDEIGSIKENLKDLACELN